MDNNINYLEYDPIEPFIFEEAKVLILGSFPAKKARESGFYYAHPSNQFWKVLAKVLNEELPETISEKKQMLFRNKIALWNVCKACSIKGSKDSSIKNVVPHNLAKKIKKTNIKKIFTSGKMAGKLYQKYSFESVGLENEYLPSTSAVNRPNYNFEKLVEHYSKILKYL